LVNPTLPLESDLNGAQVFFTDSSELSRHGGILLTLSTPPPSHGIISFDWNGFKQSRLPSVIRLPFVIPFQIVVGVNSFKVHHSIVDEGAIVSILSLDAWKAMGCPKLVSITDQILAFDRIPSGPLGAFP